MRCTVRAVAQRQLFASTGCLDSVLRFQTGRPLNEEQGPDVEVGFTRTRRMGSRQNIIRLWPISLYRLQQPNLGGM